MGIAWRLFARITTFFSGGIAKVAAALAAEKVGAFLKRSCGEENYFCCCRDSIQSRSDCESLLSGTVTSLPSSFLSLTLSRIM